jgi:hypothetical protein
MLEGDTTLEAFLPKGRRWLTAGAAAPAHLYQVFLISTSISGRSEVAALIRWRLRNMARIGGAANQDRNGAFGGGHQRPRSQLFIIVVV